MSLPDSKNRLKRLLKSYITVMLIGGAYAVFYSFTHIGIPCIFHSITGLNCISCGVTRMLVSLLKGNLYEAYCYNRLLFVTLPLFVFYIIRGSIQYVKYGKAVYTKIDKIIFGIFITAAVIFGFVRNLDTVLPLIH